MSAGVLGVSTVVLGSVRSSGGPSPCPAASPCLRPLHPCPLRPCPLHPCPSHCHSDLAWMAAMAVAEHPVAVGPGSRRGCGH